MSAVTDRALFKRTIEIEDITNLYFIHPLASRLVPIFARLKITPNTVSVAGMLFGLLAAVAYFHYWELPRAIIGFALMIVWHVMDGADGQLARYTQSYSYFGKVIDGISDNATFLALYLAFAISLGHQQGAWMYGLVGLSGLCHAIQSASYETQRQEYEFLGYGKAPQEPPQRLEQPRRSPVDSAVHRLFDFLHRLFFRVLSFPTARISQEFRTTMSAAVQNHPQHAAFIRERYRETLAPQIRRWSILSANYRTIGIFVSSLLKVPEFYFAFEIIGFSGFLALLIWRQGKARDTWLRRLEQRAI